MSRKNRTVFPLLCGLCALLAVPATAAPVSEPPPAQPALNDRLGVATHFVRKMRAFQHWSPQKYIPMVADLGLGWVRDEIIWAWMEKERGVYALPPKDLEWIDLAHAHGIRVVITLSGGNGTLYEDSYDPEAYARAAAFLATELKGKIHAIEVLNEPYAWYARAYGEGTKPDTDDKIDWTRRMYGLANDGRPESWLGRYVAVLNRTAEAVKAANPDIKVIGLGGFPAMNLRMIELGISPQVDGITLHPYSYRITPEIVPYPATPENFRRNGGRDTADAEGTYASLIRASREFSARHNGPRETWITEWGYSTRRDRTGSKSNFDGFSEEAQAAYLARRYMEDLGLGVELSAIYTLVDNNHNWRDPARREFNTEDNWGIVRMDGTPKPAYDVVRRLARETIGFTVSDDLRFTLAATTARPDGRAFSDWEPLGGAVLRAPDRIASYQFKDTQGRPVIAFWSMERIGDQSPRPADLLIDVDPKTMRAEATDLLTGRVYAPVPSEKEGRLFFKDLAAPPHPVLLRLLPR